MVARWVIDWLLGWGFWWEEEEGVVAVLKHGLRSLFPQPVLCVYIYIIVYTMGPQNLHFQWFLR